MTQFKYKKITENGMKDFSLNKLNRTSSLDDLSCRGGVAGDA